MKGFFFFVIFFLLKFYLFFFFATGIIIVVQKCNFRRLRHAATININANRYTRNVSNSWVICEELDTHSYKYYIRFKISMCVYERLC